MFSPSRAGILIVMNDEIALRAESVTKAYGEVRALRGVNLEVLRGECVALLGPNGAGKTTMTEIFEGYRKRDSGLVEVLGHDPEVEDLEWRTRLGIVLQHANDLMDITVLEAVSHFALFYPRPADVDEVIAAVGLEHKRTAKVRHLSGGQRRRLDVALGVIGQPEVLFLDEPTTGFDPEARRQFWTLIEDLKKRGTTILLTTHYLDEAEALADRVAIIAHGQVLADDSPSALRSSLAGTARVRWLEDGVVQEQATEWPTEFVGGLMQRFDGEIPQLAVVRPSLEDVYLELVSNGVDA